MKCRRLRFNDPAAWVHRLWCAECRKYRREDAEIQRHIDAYAVHLADLTDVPVARPARVWGLGYTALCLGIGAAATLAILFSLPQSPAVKRPSGISARHTDVPRSKPQNPIDKTEPRREVVAGNGPPRKGLVRQTPEAPKVFAFNTRAATSKDSDLDYINDGRMVFGQRTQETFRNPGSVDHNPSLPPMKDDFVAPPELTFAASWASPGQAAEAEAEYKRQAAISDDRLAKAVTFESKSDSLTEICASLTQQVGVQIYAGRSVADDNVTLYMTKRPARDVMRALTRLFGYLWHRTGTNGVYTYTLEQEMKDQVAEDKLRNEDVSSALAQVVDSAKRPPQRKEESPLDRPAVEEIIRKQFGALSIDEFQELRSGKEVVLSSEPGAARTLASDRAITLMDNMGRLKPFGNGGYIWTGHDGTSPSEIAGTVVKISYKLSVLELGGVRANGSVNVLVKKEDGTLMSLPYSTVLANVPGIGEATPNNATNNGDLASVAELGASIKVEPKKWSFQKVEKDYPLETWTESVSAGGAEAWRALPDYIPPALYCTTGDVWEAVHKATGMDIVADSYSRLYPWQARSGSLFEALNTYGDAMHVRWRYQDKAIFARSTTYEWQRLNETPKRLISQWKASRAKGALNIHDLIAMAQLSDRQLDSVLPGSTIYHYHGVPEWGMVARPWMGEYGYLWRRFLRALGNLSPAMTDQMVNHPFDLEKMPQGARQQLVDAFGPWRNGYPVAMAVDYVPSESFFWNPPYGKYAYESLGVRATTGAALKKLLEQKGYTPGEQEIVHTRGHLKLVFYGPGPRIIMQIGDGGQVSFIDGD